MVFDSTVRRELARGFAATLVVILTIVITMLLIRTVGQAAKGQIAPQDVVLLLGYVTLGYLPLMLALSLFVAIVINPVITGYFARVPGDTRRAASKWPRRITALTVLATTTERIRLGTGARIAMEAFCIALVRDLPGHVERGGERGERAVSPGHWLPPSLISAVRSR